MLKYIYCLKEDLMGEGSGYYLCWKWNVFEIDTLIKKLKIERKEFDDICKNCNGIFENIYCTVKFEKKEDVEDVEDVEDACDALNVFMKLRG